MITINKDLRELELKESDLSAIFWRKDDVDGVDHLKQSIREQFSQLLKPCSTPRDQERLRGLVSHIVVLGAIRGLEWGLKLKDRDAKHKTAGDDQIIKCIIKHPKVVKLFLDKTEKVSAKEICMTLDSRNEKLPWPKLAKVDRLWSAHYKDDTVKNAIKRARNRVKENAADIKYLRSFAKGKQLPPAQATLFQP